MGRAARRLNAMGNDRTHACVSAPPCSVTDLLQGWCIGLLPGKKVPPLYPLISPPASSVLLILLPICRGGQAIPSDCLTRQRSATRLISARPRWTFVVCFRSSVCTPGLPTAWCGFGPLDSVSVNHCSIYIHRLRNRRFAIKRITNHSCILWLLTKKNNLNPSSL